ncbi:MAG: MlaD family protein [Planctomycetales bacterium]|nr:MlaD family protein [Planctomycetales bacterium]
MRYDRIERHVGTFLIASGAALVAALVITAHGRHWFVSARHVRFQVPEGSGLRVGTPVTVLGLAAGEVESLEATEGATPEGRRGEVVEVTARIVSPHYNRVRADSEVNVKLPFLFGETSVDISPGTAGEAPAKDGASLRPRLTKGIGGKVEQLIDEATGTLANLKGTAANLEKATRELDTLLKDAGTIVHGLATHEGTVGRLLGDEAALYKKLEGFVEGAGGATKSLGDAAGKLDGILGDLSGKVPKLVEDLGTFAATAGKVSPDLDAMVKSLRSVAGEASEGNLGPALAGARKLLDADLPDVVRKLQALLADIGPAGKDIRAATLELPETVRAAREATRNAQDIALSLRGNFLVKGNLPEQTVVPREIPFLGRD